ncbi:MAG: RecQ family ATP-dependent DNA helicase, partial [Flavobacterium sp.]
TNTSRKYKSDWRSYLSESKIQDFTRIDSDIIYVSTIHKAKGKEFYNVFIMLENFDASTDEAKRKLYVAMTRAKSNLSIHVDSNSVDGISVENLERIEDNSYHNPPLEIVMQLGLKDVVLDYFLNRQHTLRELRSGDRLHIDGPECFDSTGHRVLRFSNKFLVEIETKRNLGYEVKSVAVNFMVYWLKEGAEEESLIVLPEVWFVKRLHTVISKTITS